MNRRRFLVGTAVAITSVGLASRSASTDAQQNVPWEPVLPEGIAFEVITAPSVMDLTRASQLAYITRNTWEPGSAAGGFCYDLHSGGPQIIVVEDGTLGTSMYGSNQDTIATLERTGLPTAFLASKDHSPAALTPESRLELQPGDVIVYPYGWECGRYVAETEGAPAQFMEIQLFPSGYQQPTHHPDLGYFGERLDISFGMVTVNEPVPPGIIAGRLHIDAGGSLLLESLGIPLALHLESGDVTLNTVQDSGLLRSVSNDGPGASLPLASGEDVAVVPEQQVYVPANATGTLISAQSAVLMLVGIDISGQLAG